MDLFKHKDQKQFYSDYAIKNGQALNEDNINLSLKRFKKEADHAYNIAALIVGMDCVPYSPFATYEIGELVHFEGEDYICIKNSLNNKPTDTAYWTLCTLAIKELLGIIDLSNYLSKTNQIPYEPGDMQAGESSTQYHPATVKFVEDRIEWHLSNSVITNSDRLDGLHADDFAKKTDLEALSRIIPYNLPFLTNDLNVITTTPAATFDTIIDFDSFAELYVVIANITKSDLRFDNNNNRVVASYAAENTATNEQIISICLAGPFKGFGVNEGDYCNGLISIEIVKDTNSNAYKSVNFYSNCVKVLETQEEYDAIANKSHYVQYNVISGTGTGDETMGGGGGEVTAGIATYNIPFLSTDMNTITTTAAANFTTILSSVGFDELYSTIDTKQSDYDFRFNSGKNRVVGAYVSSDASSKTILVSIAGPFLGFGAEATDFTSGVVTLKIVRNNDGTYSEVKVESNCVKRLTRAEYNAITTKSDYIQYNIN